jgi:homeobox-leucine zipper protein
VYFLGLLFILTSFLLCPFRGFNDAISGFNDDGWSVMGGDGIEDVIIACNSKKIRSNNTVPNAFEAPGGVICAKASMLLQVRMQCT